MELERINHPYLTAIKRADISVPTRYLLKHGLLKGRILDYGCGFGFDTDELKRQGDMTITIVLIIQKRSLTLSSAIMC